VGTRAPWRNCLWCLDPFKVRENSIYCSNRCRGLDQAIKSQPIPWKQCGCGQWFVTRYGRATCGCGYRPPKQLPPPVQRTCRECEQVFTWQPGHGGGTPTFCGPRCRNRKKQRYNKSHYRRAIRHGVAFERFDPHEIFDRDRWRCHLCGGRISRARIYPHPLSPTIDHVVPLACGGGHTRANVKAAHARCNLAKGGRGQLVLAI